MSTQDAKTPDDILYHLSNTAMRLEVDLENCAVDVITSQRAEEVIMLLRRYVKDVKAIRRLEADSCSPFTELHYLCA